MLLHKLALFGFDLVLPLLVGYLLRKLCGVDRRKFDSWMVFGIVALFPVLLTLSFWILKLRAQLLWVPIIGVLMQLIPGGLALFRTRKFETSLERGSYLMSAMLSNRGAVGTFTVYVLYDEAMYAFARLTMLLAPLVVYAFCFPLAGYYQTADRGPADRPSLWSLLVNRNQMPTVGIIVGCSLNYFGVPRPEVCTQIFPIMVHCAAWVFLVPIGLSLQLRDMPPYIPKLAELLALKFIIVPLLIGLISYACGFRGDELIAIAIVAASPTAINSVIVAKFYGLDLSLALTAFMLTTVVYLLVVLPALIFFLGSAS